ncbi:hypothetical protein Mapa_007403 [Marchantia paleacea]|nr:hypothetical protein Mapa_007403 [Marchantia paleacea]
MSMYLPISINRLRICHPRTHNLQCEGEDRRLRGLASLEPMVLDPRKNLRNSTGSS